MHRRTGTTIVYVTHDQIEAMTLGERIAVLNQGEIQQFGSPREIYDNPENLFVAGFIGSPSMNFITARVVSAGQGVGVRLEGEGNAFTLPVADGLNEWIDREVIFGIRPEQITHKIASQLAHPQTHTAHCTVDITEPTGPDTLVFIRLNGQTVVCRVHPDEAKPPGEAMELMFDLSKAVFFDPRSERRIRLA